jgi:hypothetical protein
MKQGGSLAERRSKFAQSLTALNSQFASWINDQDKNEVWTDGVEDYLTYAKKLVQEYSDVLNSPEDTTKGAPPVNGSVFGRLGGSAAPASTTAAAPSGGFNFAAAPAAGGFTGFSTGGAAAAPENQDDEDDAAAQEEETGPSVQLGDSNVDILLSERVTLQSQEEKTWKDRGPGMLTVRRMKNAPESSPFLVFTNDVGAIMINATLYKGFQFLEPAKTPKSILMMLISKKTPDSPEEKGTHIFKFASLDTKKQVSAKIKELTAK